MTYNWPLKNWPYFQYDLETLQALFKDLALDWAELNSMKKGLSKDLEEEALLNIKVLGKMFDAGPEGFKGMN